MSRPPTYLFVENVVGFEVLFRESFSFIKIQVSFALMHMLSDLFVWTICFSALSVIASLWRLWRRPNFQYRSLFWHHYNLAFHIHGLGIFAWFVDFIEMCIIESWCLAKLFCSRRVEPLEFLTHMYRPKEYLYIFCIHNWIISYYTILALQHHLFLKQMNTSCNCLQVACNSLQTFTDRNPVGLIHAHPSVHI